MPSNDNTAIGWAELDKLNGIEQGATANPTVSSIAALRAGGLGAAGKACDVQGYYAANDGGGGLFDWVASSSAADNGGTIINPTGNAGSGRWIRRFSGHVNVLWFGAKPSASRADDTINQTAFQAAIDFGKAIFVPCGKYFVAGPLKFATNTPTTIIGESFPGLSGDDSAIILDNRQGTEEEPLFRNPTAWKKYDGTFVNNSGTQITGEEDVGWQGSVCMENLTIDCGSRDRGTAVQVIRSSGNSFRNLNIFARRCLELNFATFDNTIIGCTFRGGGMEEADNWEEEGILSSAVYTEFLRNYGLYAEGHAYVFGCTAISCGSGFRLSGSVSLQGARAENNCIAYALGWPRDLPSGSSNNRLASCEVNGLSGEANIIGMSINAIGTATISDVSILGTQPPLHPWPSFLGVEIRNAEIEAKLARINCVGSFTYAAIVNKTLATIDQGLAQNTISTAAKAGAQQAAFSKYANSYPTFSGNQILMFPNATERRYRTITAFHDLMVPGLTGLNLYKTASSGAAAGGAVFSKNLGGTVTPANNASTATVAFDIEADAGIVSFAEVTLQAGGSLTADTTYYYTTISIGAAGACGPNLSDLGGSMYKSVTTTSSNKQVYISLYGAYGLPMEQRIYRSTTPGVFSGYWKLNSGVYTFTDTGAIAFHGYSPPHEFGSIPSRIEDDANYQIVATASWGTTVWVTNKATTGFTLNFGTAAPDGNQTVSWLLFRP